MLVYVTSAMLKKWLAKATPFDSAMGRRRSVSKRSVSKRSMSNNTAMSGTESTGSSPFQRSNSKSLSRASSTNSYKSAQSNFEPLSPRSSLPRVRASNAKMRLHAQAAIRSAYAVLDSVAHINGFRGGADELIRYSFAVYIQAIEDSVCNGSILNRCRPVVKRLTAAVTQTLLATVSRFNKYVVDKVLTRFGLERYLRPAQVAEVLREYPGVVKDFLLGKPSKMKLVDLLVKLVDTLDSNQMVQWVGMTDGVPGILTGAAGNRNKARNMVAYVRTQPASSTNSRTSPPPRRLPSTSPRRLPSTPPRRAPSLRRTSSSHGGTTLSRSFLDDPRVQRVMIKNWLNSNNHFGGK